MAGSVMGQGVYALSAAARARLRRKVSPLATTTFREMYGSIPAGAVQDAPTRGACAALAERKRPFALGVARWRDGCTGVPRNPSSRRIHRPDVKSTFALDVYLEPHLPGVLDA